MPSRPEEKSTFSLFDQEEEIIQHAEEMVRMLDEVARGVRRLAEAYRQSYRAQERLLRMSDRMQLDLQQANQQLAKQAESLHKLNQALSDEAVKRRQLTEQLETLAMTDELTGLAARRRIIDIGTREANRSNRHDTAVCLMMLDIDHFKEVNDSYGHAAGDAVLIEFARIITTLLRSIDDIGRMGGEEFLAVLPDTRLDQALTVAERIRHQIEQHTFRWDEHRIRLTVSIGLVQHPGSETSLDQLIMQADRALYATKAAGRNSIRLIDPVSQLPVAPSCLATEPDG